MRTWYLSIVVAGLVACNEAAKGPASEGDPGESPDVSLASADLVRPWARLAVPEARETASIVRTPEGFVALAREQTPTGSKSIGEVYNYLYRSADGVRWRRLPLPENELIYGKTQLLYGAGRYLVVETSGGRSALWTSTDLVQWSKPALPSDHDGGDVAPFDPRRLVRARGMFIGGGTDAVFISSDGLTWRRSFLPLVQGRGAAYGNGAFVVRGALSIVSSRDGVAWERSAAAGGTGHVVFLDGAFYADGMTSSDGVRWNGYDGGSATDAVGGYLFDATGNERVGGETASSGLRVWRPGESMRVIASDAPVPSAPLARGVGPDEISTPLPGGETCLTHRCVVVGGGLYLIR